LQTPVLFPSIPQLNPYSSATQLYAPCVVPSISKDVPIPPPPPPQNKSSAQSDTVFKPPSLQELLNAKKSLNKTVTVVKGTLQTNEKKSKDNVPVKKTNSKTKKADIKSDTDSDSDTESPKKKTSKMPDKNTKTTAPRKNMPKKNDI
jgi:hypothetical protein